jgi:hypothetical protein
LGAAGDGWDEHDLIAFLKRVGVPPEEADVFVVDVDVDESPQLASAGKLRSISTSSAGRSAASLVSCF